MGMRTKIFTYDGTFDGLLSVVFEIYRLQSIPENIVSEDQFVPNFFDQPIYVATNHEWSKRVQNGVKQKTSKNSVRLLYRCFLSEQSGIELLIYDFIVKAMKSSINIESDYSDPTILSLHQINKKIGREVHRMHAFVRFQETRDGLFAGWIEPDFNVLPLIGDHFEKRYPAMEWLIFDIKRKYGIHYNLEKIVYTTLIDFNPKQIDQNEVMTHEEVDYQSLWRVYFKSTDIPERRNMKLHLQHVPKRYWKYLTEKQ